ncbi:MAG: GNAT family N-acetyltransferase [Chloroflexi bacterium]|nr:GNAT family N-acetyltransferase [Chloroflexota bacterium]
MASHHKAKILEGRKIVLRAKHVDDARKDYTWASDSEIMRLDAADYIPLSYSAYLVKYVEGLHDPTKRQFAIETHEGKHIGNCVCYNFHNLYKEAELGIVIGDREYWGKGFGSDAVVTLARFIFDELEVKRICLHTLTWNIRAQRCFEKCGFVACGKETRNGREFVEMELYAG